MQAKNIPLIELKQLYLQFLWSDLKYSKFFFFFNDNWVVY